MIFALTKSAIWMLEISNRRSPSGRYVAAATFMSSARTDGGSVIPTRIDHGDTAATTPAAAPAVPDSPASAPAAGGAVPPKYVKYAVGLIKRYDTNKDGVLTKEEWTSMTKDYSSGDADKDGRLTPVELGAALMQR